MSADRAGRLQRLGSETFDLIVVGGGITGAAIAAQAAQSGLATALLEEQDFGSGTSSASSKMLHGGLRYLEHGKIKLVKEALHERGRLVRRLGTARAKTIPFLLPLRGSSSRRLQLRFGTWLYQRLSGSLALGPRSVLSPEQVLQKVPQLRSEGLRGGIEYYEGVVDDTFLVLELVHEAADAGAVVLNHANVTGPLLTGGRIEGVAFRDLLSGTESTVRAKSVVNAAGVWSRSWAGESRSPPMRPSKGVHLVFRKSSFPLSEAVVMEAEDRRWVFALPYGSLVVVGTTDTDYDGDYRRVRPQRADLEYLMSTVEREFPGAKVRPQDIVDAYAGLRPLLAGQGDTTSELSREDLVYVDPSGLVTTVGGKLTTHAAMARRTLDRLGPSSRSRPLVLAGPKETTYSGRPWPGSDWLLGTFALEPPARQALVRSVVQEAVQYLGPCTLEDIIDRRLHALNRLEESFDGLIEEISRTAAGLLEWPEEERLHQCQNYREHLREYEQETLRFRAPKGGSA